MTDPIRDHGLAIWLDPQSLRDHFDSATEGIPGGISDQALAQAAEVFLDSDSTWDAFHAWCQRIVELAVEQQQDIDSDAAEAHLATLSNGPEDLS